MPTTATSRKSPISIPGSDAQPGTPVARSASAGDAGEDLGAAGAVPDSEVEQQAGQQGRTRGRNHDLVDRGAARGSGGCSGGGEKVWKRGKAHVCSLVGGDHGEVTLDAD